MPETLKLLGLETEQNIPAGINSDIRKVIVNKIDEAKQIMSSVTVSQLSFLAPGKAPVQEDGDTLDGESQDASKPVIRPSK